MLDNIFADAYGRKTPLNQLGNISTPDPSTITIQVWDTSLLKVLKAQFRLDLASILKLMVKLLDYLFPNL